MRPPMPLLAVVLTALLSPALLRGQAITQGIEAGTSLGGSLDWFRSDGVVDVGFTHRRTTLRRNAPGLDLGVTVFPAALAQRALVLAADVGLAQGTRLGSSLLLLKGGASTLLVAGAGYGTLAAGLHFGLGALLPLEPRGAVRIDLIRHYYAGDRGPTVVWSVGVGFALLPRPNCRDASFLRRDHRRKRLRRSDGCPRPGRGRMEGAAPGAGRLGAPRTAQLGSRVGRRPHLALLD